MQRATANNAIVFFAGANVLHLPSTCTRAAASTCVLKRGGSFASNPVYLAVSNLLCMKIK